MTKVDFELSSVRAEHQALDFLQGNLPRSEIEDNLIDAVESWRLFVKAAQRTGEAVSENNARWAGRQQSVLAHVLLQSAYVEPSTLEQFGTATSFEYEVNLQQLREIAAGNSLGLSNTHEQILSTVLGSGTELARQVGSSNINTRGIALEGIAVCELLRRCSAMLAWACFLDYRMSKDTSWRGLRRVIENRPSLRRVREETRIGDTNVIGREPLSRFAISGKVVETGWVDRPETPYSFARFDHEQFELRVHYRSILAVGVAPGRWLWARAKLEPTSDSTVLVAEFEGLGEHASIHWEDWLASQTRSAYDLAPSSLDVLWEFPNPSYFCGLQDLSSRISDSLIGGAL